MKLTVQQAFIYFIEWVAVVVVVGGVERGERNVAPENIVKLAKALTVPSKELFIALP